MKLPGTFTADDRQGMSVAAMTAFGFAQLVTQRERGIRALVQYLDLEKAVFIERDYARWRKWSGPSRTDDWFFFCAHAARVTSFHVGDALVLPLM